MLLDIHENVVDIISVYAIELLTILERYDKTDSLETGVLSEMRRGSYANALDHLRNFILEDDAMFKLLPELVDKAERGLSLPNDYAEEYRLSALL